MDSDTMLITDNEFLIATAKRNYSNYKVPTNCVESKKTARTAIAREKSVEERIHPIQSTVIFINQIVTHNTNLLKIIISIERR